MKKAHDAMDYFRFGQGQSNTWPNLQLMHGLSDIPMWAQGATRSFAFTSGMGALTTVLRVAGVGDHIVAGDDLYGGTSRLLAQVAPGLGLDVTHVDTTDIE